MASPTGDRILAAFQAPGVDTTQQRGVKAGLSKYTNALYSSDVIWSDVQ